jgi:hypothetical protein
MAGFVNVNSAGGAWGVGNGRGVGSVCGFGVNVGMGGAGCFGRCVDAEFGSVGNTAAGSGEEAGVGVVDCGGN